MRVISPVSAPGSTTHREARHSLKPRKYTSCTDNPPIPAAVANISPCTPQARSHVGWRLIVASSANTSLGRAAPVARGASRFAWSRKDSIRPPVAAACVMSFLSLMRHHVAIDPALVNAGRRAWGSRGPYWPERKTTARPERAAEARSVQDPGDRLGGLSFPGLRGNAVHAGIPKAIAQVDEVPLGRFEIDLDLVVLDGFELRGRVALESCRHFGIGKGDGHGPEDRGEFVVQIARLEIAHLDEIPIRMLTDLVTPVPAFRRCQEHRNLHSTYP